MLVCSLTMKSRKRLVRDIIYTSTTHPTLAHDIRDTARQAKNGRALGNIFTTFKRGFFRSKLDPRSAEKLLCVYSLFHFY